MLIREVREKYASIMSMDQFFLFIEEIVDNGDKYSRESEIRAIAIYCN